MNSFVPMSVFIPVMESLEYVSVNQATKLQSLPAELLCGCAPASQVLTGRVIFIPAMASPEYLSVNQATKLQSLPAGLLRGCAPASQVLTGRVAVMRTAASWCVARIPHRTTAS